MKYYRPSCNNVYLSFFKIRIANVIAKRWLLIKEVEYDF